MTKFPILSVSTVVCLALSTVAFGQTRSLKPTTSAKKPTVRQKAPVRVAKPRSTGALKPTTTSRAATVQQASKSNSKQAASVSGAAANAQSGQSNSGHKVIDGIQVTYPNGGEELVSGSLLNIRWDKVQSGGNVKISLLVKHNTIGSAQLSALGLSLSGNVSPQYEVPMVIMQNAPNTGSYQYRLPVKMNSMFGTKYKVMVEQSSVKDMSDGFFEVYPEVDLTPINIRIRNKQKNKNWFLKAVGKVVVGAVVPGLTEKQTIQEAREYIRSNKEQLRVKNDIIIEFDTISWGTKILRKQMMSKVAIRLDPGNAELNSGGFTENKIVPGRKYHHKATIKAKDWDIAPGNYRLEIWVDPQNVASEPEELRANNKKIIHFTIK